MNEHNTNKQTDAMVIRPVTVAQAPVYADVIRRAFATVANDLGLTRDNCPRHTSFITDERLINEYGDGYHPYGCFVGDAIVGFVALTKNDGGSYDMGHLAVLPEYRHLGYGRRLIDFCKSEVIRFGGGVIEISLIDDYAVLKNWYAVNGFVHTDAKVFDGLPFTVGFMRWEEIYMNETLKSIADRYSCRDFADTPLTEAQVKAIVDAALAAPSAMNRMPWHVIMITDKSLVDAMDAAGMEVLAAAEEKTGYERIKARGGKIFYNAPCMVMIASDDSSYGSMDCGILSQNVSLAAHSLGLGSVICGMAGIPLNGPHGDELKKRMSFPDGYVFGMAVLIGTANNEKAPHEPDYAKVTYVK